MSFDVKVAREVLGDLAERYDVISHDMCRIDAYADDIKTQIKNPTPGTAAAKAMTHREQIEQALEVNFSSSHAVNVRVAQRFQDSHELYERVEQENTEAARKIWTGEDGTPPPTYPQGQERHTERTKISSKTLGELGFPGPLPRDMDDLELVDALVKLDLLYWTGDGALKAILDWCCEFVLHYQTLEEAAESWLPVRQFGIAGTKISDGYGQLANWNQLDAMAVSFAWTGPSGYAAHQYMLRMQAWQQQVAAATLRLRELDTMARSAYLLQVDLYDLVGELIDLIAAANDVVNFITNSVAGGGLGEVIGVAVELFAKVFLEIGEKMLEGIAIALKIWSAAVTVYQFTSLLIASGGFQFDNISLTPVAPSGL